MQDAYLKLTESLIETQKVEVFNNPRFGEVRTAIDEQGEPWFCLADVCRVLELRVDGVTPRLREGGYNRIVVTDALGRNQGTTFVNEQNLYRVIMRSDKPNAEPFQDWVCGEVLPSIRKTGQYSVQNLSRKELALMVIQAEEEKERLMIENKAQADKIAEDAPKVEFHDNIIASDDTCLVRELAKILTQRGFKIGQNRLYEILRNEGFLHKSGSDRNSPRQEYVENGLFEIDWKPWTNPHTGERHIGKTSKVTPKGIKYFVMKFIGRTAVL